MKVVKFLGKAVLGLLLMALLLYGVGVAINWRDEAPSAAALELDRVIEARPEVATADNAMVYVLGFTAAADQEPVDIGYLRFQWLQEYEFASDRKPDPLRNALSFVQSGAAVVRHIRDNCKPRGDRQVCEKTFGFAVREWQPDELESLALRRYEALLTRRAWRDIVPLNLDVPLPPFSEVMHVQRMYYLRLAQLAQQGNVDELARGLDADHEFWRAALPQADALIVKMVETAALRSHFFYSTLILRGMKPAQVAHATPGGWSREFSVGERSMLRVLASEFAFHERLIHDAKYGRLAADLSLRERFMDSLSSPFLQAQATTNLSAKDLLQLSRSFDVPLAQYEQVARSVRAEVRAPAASPYNPIGKSFWSAARNSSYLDYVFRVGNVEALRRAALLVAELHSKGVAAADAAAEVARPSLRDPYTDAAFKWNASRASVLFNGNPGLEWQREEFLY